MAMGQIAKLRDQIPTRASHVRACLQTNPQAGYDFFYEVFKFRFGDETLYAAHRRTSVCNNISSAIEFSLDANTAGRNQGYPSPLTPDSGMRILTSWIVGWNIGHGSL
jgi:hypothetical protein